MFEKGIFERPTGRMRVLAFIEGVSYIVLLLIAMPLKYYGGMPLAVTIVGAMHGVLFVWLAWCTLEMMQKCGKSFAWGCTVGVLSLVPFGTFFLDKGLREDDEAYAASLGSGSYESGAEAPMRHDDSKE